MATVRILRNGLCPIFLLPQVDSAALSLILQAPGVKGNLSSSKRISSIPPEKLGREVKLCLVSTSQKRKTPGRWGERPGVGVTAEGGRRKLEKFLVHLVHSQHANLSQLFVSEKCLFLFSRALLVSQ